MPRDMSKLDIHCDHILVVEGTHEVAFLGELTKRANIMDFDILPIGGKTQLADNLATLKDNSDFQSNVRSMGIIRDADDDPKAAFQSVASALERNGLPTPSQPLEVEEGTFLAAGDLEAGPVRVSVMIMPTEGQTGALEDLCVASVGELPEYECVEGLFECLERLRNQHGDAVVLPKHPGKARAHAFLATRPDPDKHMGNAAEAGYWPLDHPAFDQVKAFIQQVAQ